MNKHKVLIIDDEKKARDYISELFLSLVPDSKITKVAQSHEALQLIETHTYDLLFADIQMPQMDGLTLLQEIKRRGKKPFIVLVSAYDKFEYAQKGMELGASGYILKPINKDRIHCIFQNYLKEKKQNKDPETIIFNKSNGFFPLRTTDILAIEKQDKQVLKVYKKEACICNFRGTLHKISEQLSDNFMYINRQCIVNSCAIERFNTLSKEIILRQNDGELRFTASRDNMKQIRDLFKNTSS